MAWQDETIPTLRVMLGDMSETNPTYSDDTLEQTLLVAAKQVASTLVFSQTYAVSVMNGTLTPDPTIGDNKDESFVNLFTLKAACILDRTEASLAARRGIIVKDGSSMIDLSKVSDTRLKLLSKGWCAVYDKESIDYQLKFIQGVAGAAVLTPFRLFAWETFGGTTFGESSFDPRSRHNYL